MYDERFITPMRQELTRKIGEVVRGLAATQARDSVWPGKKREVCKALDCGFIGRCHPHAKSNAQLTLL